MKAGYPDVRNILYNKYQFNELSGKGNSVSYLVVYNSAVGLVAQGDEIKSEANIDQHHRGRPQLHDLEVEVMGLLPCPVEQEP